MIDRAYIDPEDQPLPDYDPDLDDRVEERIPEREKGGTDYAELPRYGLMAREDARFRAFDQIDPSRL